MLLLISFADMPPPIPRRDRLWPLSFTLLSSTAQTMAAFSELKPDRLPPFDFSRLARCSLYIAACPLAARLMRTLHRELRQLCYLRCRPDCYRLERPICRAGISPAENQRLCTAHCRQRHNRWCWRWPGAYALRYRRADSGSYKHRRWYCRRPKSSPLRPVRPLAALLPRQGLPVYHPPGETRFSFWEPLHAV